MVRVATLVVVGLPLFRIEPALNPLMDRHIRFPAVSIRETDYVLRLHQTLLMKRIGLAVPRNENIRREFEVRDRRPPLSGGAGRG